MAFFHLLLYLILPAAILTILHIVKRHKRSVQPPGPPGLPFFGNLFQLDSAAPHIHLHRLAKKYGPLMSLKFGSVTVVVVSSPRIAKEVLKTHDLAFSSRPKLLGQHKLSYNGLDVAFTSYSKSWSQLRKICVVHLLSTKQVRSFRPIREEEVFDMVRKLAAAADSGSVTAANLSEMMLSLSSSLICRVAFGKKFEKDGLEQGRFRELMIDSQVVFGSFFVSDYLPLFGWMDRVRGLIGKLDKVFKSFDEFYQEIIDQHLDANRRKKAMNPDILDLLIQLKEDDSCSVHLTWNHIKGILMNIFLAATDTAASAIVWAIVWAMTALIQTPTAMSKLQEEIRGIVKAQGRVNEDDITMLPYLKAVVKETFRLYPPSPLLLPRETQDCCIIDGYQIPSRTHVYINAWAIARDPEYWENAEAFIPERFLNSDVDIVGNDFQVIPFGGGRRGCPGISMGLATVELVLANLVYSFDWELPVGIKREDIDTEVCPGITMHKKNQLCLVPKIYRVHE